MGTVCSVEVKLYYSENSAKELLCDFKMRPVQSN